MKEQSIPPTAAGPEQSALSSADDGLWSGLDLFSCLVDALDLLMAILS